MKPATGEVSATENAEVDTHMRGWFTVERMSKVISDDNAEALQAFYNAVQGMLAYDVKDRLSPEACAEELQRILCVVKSAASA